MPTSSKPINTVSHSHQYVINAAQTIPFQVSIRFDLSKLVDKALANLINLQIRTELVELYHARFNVGR